MVYFYLHSDNEEVKDLFARFIKGMNTGRERSKLIRRDIVKRQQEFFSFFEQDLEAVYNLYVHACKLREQEKYKLALDKLLDIMKLVEPNVAILRLSAEVSWEGESYGPSLAFWRRLAEMDPKDTHYQWRICCRLVAFGLSQNNPDTLKEAVETGVQVVRRTKSQDPDCLAALAIACAPTCWRTPCSRTRRSTSSPRSGASRS